MPIKQVRRGVDSQGPYYKKGDKKVHYQSGDKRSRASAHGRVVAATGGFSTGGVRPKASIAELRRLAAKENLQHGIKIGPPFKK